VSMGSSQRAVSRRTVLGAAAILALTRCSRSETPSSSASSTSSSTSTTAASDQHDRLIELERTFDARLGVFALATDTGTTIAHRADERFAFCSTFKGLAAAAVLDRNPLSHLDEVVTYTDDDLMSYAPITAQHVATGMTIRALIDAALRYSDGTAGNLLVRDLGGPGELTAYLRTLGDTVTRMDRIEPAITEATPGDPRDTSSPRALGADYRQIVLGDALPTDKRAFLQDLLERTTTGANRIRAGTPRGWTVADKTGTGSYGTMNDIAIVWPPDSAPLVIAIMSSKATADADSDAALIAEAATYAVTTLRPA
jgi:beta-lactamase class A